MNTKIPIAESSKAAENTSKNNIKNNLNIIELTEQELKDILFNEVILKNEIKETLIQFIRWRTQVYEQRKYRSLSDIFAKDFQQFNKDDFKSLNKDTRYSLRDCLRANEMYIRKGRGVTVSQALADVVQKNTPWPEDNEERPPTKPRVYPQQAQATATPAAASTPSNTSRTISAALSSQSHPGCAAPRAKSAKYHFLHFNIRSKSSNPTPITFPTPNHSRIRNQAKP